MRGYLANCREGRVQEFLHHARRELRHWVSLLRLCRYPVFDADNEPDRTLVAQTIRDQVRDDLLLNVLFGRLNATDVGMLLQGNGIPGLLIAVLDEVARHGFFNFMKHPEFHAPSGFCEPAGWSVTCSE